MNKAVVLLGYRNAGKDTQAQLLIDNYPGFCNVKFSQLTKEMLAQMMFVPVSFTNDKVWREKPIKWNMQKLELTPLDILDTLFAGATENSKLTKANLKYTLDNITESSIPVFTDIRREQEMKAVLDAFDDVQVFHLSRANISASSADSDVCRLALDNDAYALYSLSNPVDNSIKEMHENIVQRLKQKEFIKENKPTLYIFVECLCSFTLPLYEPLSNLLADIAETLNNHLVSAATDSVIKLIVENFGSVASFSDVDITPLKTDSQMHWQHMLSPILPRIRTQANVKLVLNKEVKAHSLIDFTQEEIDNAIIN